MKYQLKCLKTNSLIEDNYTLHYSDDALLQTKYQQMLSKNEHYGVWKYHPWLPVSGVSEFIAGSTTYKATKLGLELGLNNLWVCFHGYWPEKEDYAQLEVSKIWKQSPLSKDCAITMERV